MTLVIYYSILPLSFFFWRKYFFVASFARVAQASDAEVRALLLKSLVHCHANDSCVGHKLFNPRDASIQLSSGVLHKMKSEER